MYRIICTYLLFSTWAALTLKLLAYDMYVCKLKRRAHEVSVVSRCMDVCLLTMPWFPVDCSIVLLLRIGLGAGFEYLLCRSELAI